MSREDWEVFELMRKQRKVKRRERQTVANKSFPDLTQLCKNQGCKLDVTGPGQWIVRRGGKGIIQYWPSANKWQVCKTGKIHKGSLEKFAEFIVKGTY